jgi:hypothetical protein
MNTLARIERSPVSGNFTARERAFIKLFATALAGDEPERSAALKAISTWWQLKQKCREPQ